MWRLFFGRLKPIFDASCASLTGTTARIDCEISGWLKACLCGCFECFHSPKCSPRRNIRRRRTFQVCRHQERDGKRRWGWGWILRGWENEKLNINRIVKILLTLKVFPVWEENSRCKLKKREKRKCAIFHRKEKTWEFLIFASEWLNVERPRMEIYLSIDFLYSLTSLKFKLNC